MAELSFGQWLKQQRQLLDLTQAELAAKIGCSWETLRKIEANTLRPSKQIAARLAQNLDIASDQIAAFISFARSLPGAQPPGAASTQQSPITRGPAHPPHSLVTPQTSFVGREQELALLHKLIRRADVQILTLTGPGGVGKTRLALRVAADQLGEFADGMFLVALASVQDPALVVPTIAQTLGVKETRNRSLHQALADFLQAKQLLLLLDNFEHVVAAAPALLDILAAAPQIRLLITSRAPLRLPGEQEFSVAPLALPPKLRRQTVPILASYPSVALFVERAQQLDPSFRLTSDNADVVAAICQRLDGLPLAIELAAGRVRLLTPHEIRARLDHQLALLQQSRATDLDSQHQTMRSAIAWSYDLLSSTEQWLFKRLAVFSAGFTVEAAEFVCGAKRDHHGEPLDDLESLLDKNLLQLNTTGEQYLPPRMAMLNTVRAFAREQLDASDEANIVSSQHAQYFLAMVEAAMHELHGPQQRIWFARLEAEHDNLRAAISWALAQEQAELALRLGHALGEFWVMHGHLSEGRSWLEAVLKFSHPDATITHRPVMLNSLDDIQRNHLLYRARCLRALGVLIGRAGDYALALRWLEQARLTCASINDRQGLSESLSEIGAILVQQGLYENATRTLNEGLNIARDLGDKRAIALAFKGLGTTANNQGDHAAAREYYEQGLRIVRELGDTWSTAQALGNLGNVVFYQGDYPAARIYYEECLALFRVLGDTLSLAQVLSNLGTLCTSQGDYVRARSYHAESLTIRRDLGDQLGIATSLDNLGNLERLLRDYAAARRFGEESLAVAHAIGYQRGMAYALCNLAATAFQQQAYALAQRQYEESLALAQVIGDKVVMIYALAKLAAIATKWWPDPMEQLENGRLAVAFLAMADTLIAETGMKMEEDERSSYEHTLEHVQTLLGEHSFTAAWAEGKGRSLQQLALLDRRMIS